MSHSCTTVCTMSIDPTGWTALRQWLTSSEPDAAARDLLGGLTPEDPHNRHELLVLALLAVCADPSRLATELDARHDLTAHPMPVDVLADYQQTLTLHLLGTSGPLWPLGAAITRHAPNHVLTQLYQRIEPDPGWITPTASHRMDVAWDAAVRMGHLSLTIATALDLPEITVYRSLQSVTTPTKTAPRPNAVSCAAQPWEAGRSQRTRIVRDDAHTLVKITAHPACLVAVAHADLDKALSAHPSTFLAETGHPAITAYPPLAVAAPYEFIPVEIARWEYATTIDNS